MRTIQPQQEIIHHSRFVDRFREKVPATVLITIHERPGLKSVTVAVWLLRGDKWSLCPLEARHSYEAALSFIPLGAEQIDVPRSYALSAWLIRKPGETKRI